MCTTHTCLTQKHLIIDPCTLKRPTNLFLLWIQGVQLLIPNSVTTTTNIISLLETLIMEMCPNLEQELLLIAVQTITCATKNISSFQWNHIQ